MDQENQQPNQETRTTRSRSRQNQRIPPEDVDPPVPLVPPPNPSNDLQLHLFERILATLGRLDTTMDTVTATAQANHGELLEAIEQQREVTSDSIYKLRLVYSCLCPRDPEPRREERNVRTPETIEPSSIAIHSERPLPPPLVTSQEREIRDRPASAGHQLRPGIIF